MASSAPNHQTAQPPHVLVVPFPTQSHVGPILSMANYLAAHGISLTIVQHVDGGLSQDAQRIDENHHAIRYVKIRSDFDHSRAFNREMFFNSLSAAEFKVTELLESLIIEENAPVCLLIDGLYPWSNGVAVRFGLSWINLLTGSASSLSIGLHIPDLVERGYLPATEEGAKDKLIDFIPGLLPLRLGEFPPVLFAEGGLQSPYFVSFTSIFDNVKSADRVFVNTMDELEKPVIEDLRRRQRLPIEPVGPLHMVKGVKSPAHHLPKDSSCLSWLDRQQPSSVLYVAFGSLVKVEEKALAELAQALEASGESLLWVLRRDTYKDKSSVEEILPEGFMERIRDRGLVVSWAPQLEVLAHPSVGGFLTHCGWNSVLESLSNGVPMLGFPQEADQASNLRLIVQDWKVGLSLLSNSQIERSAMVNAIKTLMRGDDGLQIRMRARKWKEIAEKTSQGSSKDNLQKLVDELKHGKLIRSKH